MKPNQLGPDERNFIGGSDNSCPRSSTNGSRFNHAKLPPTRRMKYLKSPVCQVTSTAFAGWIRHVIGWHLHSSSTILSAVSKTSSLRIVRLSSGPSRHSECQRHLSDPQQWYDLTKGYPTFLCSHRCRLQLIRVCAQFELGSIQECVWSPAKWCRGERCSRDERMLRGNRIYFNFWNLATRTIWKRTSRIVSIGLGMYLS